MVEHHSDGRLDRALYEQNWNSVLATFAVPPHQYMTYHKQRFYELFDHLAFYLAGNPSPRVLEIGMSPFSKLYKILFPHIKLVTVDRPHSLNGFDSAFACGECGSEYHYNLDLNRESIGAEVGDPPLGVFDYVVFTEVLEHLIVHPAQLFGELLSLLKPEGLLYLTTPNFFAFHHLQQLAAGENPQAFFPRRGEDPDASVHFREYTMLELIDLMTQAGGEIVNAHFSDCWDQTSAHPELASIPQLRSQLSLVACRKGCDCARNHELAYWRNYAQPGSLVVDGVDLISSVEITRLRRLVQSYENGRLMRLMKWLHKHGLPRF